MAQITLNTKLTSEEFTISDEDVIYINTLYVDGAAAGSILTIEDRANATTSVIKVEESVATVAGLSSLFIQITLTSSATPYINKNRIENLVKNGDDCNIMYDSNGNVHETLYTSMSLAEILALL